MRLPLFNLTIKKINKQLDIYLILGSTNYEKYQVEVPLINLLTCCSTLPGTASNKSWYLCTK